MRVSNFLELDEKDTFSFVSKEASGSYVDFLSIVRFYDFVLILGDSYHSVMQAWTARVALAASSPSPVKADLSSVPVSPSSSSIGSRAANNLQKSAARRSHRRKMVSECKGLRSQVRYPEFNS